MDNSNRRMIREKEDRLTNRFWSHFEARSFHFDSHELFFSQNVATYDGQIRIRYSDISENIGTFFFFFSRTGFSVIPLQQLSKTWLN